MKLILFMYFSAVYSHKPKKYTTQLHSKALSMVVIQWGLFLSGIALGVLHSLNVWDWLIVNWPYDYGRTHSRNWTTPSAAFAILLFLIFHQVLKQYFKQESVQQEIVSHFDNDVGRALSDRTEWWMVGQIFFNAFAGVMFGAGNYKTFCFCLLIWLAAEIRVRHMFYGSKIDVQHNMKKTKK